MWKFHNFSITQIIREINFEDSGSAKSAISTQLQAMNSAFHVFLRFLKTGSYKINKVKSS